MRNIAEEPLISDRIGKISAIGTAAISGILILDAILRTDANDVFLSGTLGLVGLALSLEPKFSHPPQADVINNEPEDYV